MLTVIFMIEIIMEIYFYDRIEAIQSNFFFTTEGVWQQTVNNFNFNCTF